MNLKVVIVVLVLLVLLFFTGVGASLCGGTGTVTSDVGWVKSLGGVLDVPRLEAGDLEVVSGGGQCLQGNALVVRTAAPCRYALKDSVWLDRRLVARQASPAGATFVVQPPNGVTARQRFPLGPGEEFRVFIERKRQMIVRKKPSQFTVSCTAPPGTAECRLPLE